MQTHKWKVQLAHLYLCGQRWSLTAKTRMHSPFVLDTTKAIFKDKIHSRLPGERKEGRKLKPLQALLLFYQKLEDKLVEYRKVREGRALRKKRPKR